jgi:hypothetical protein
VRGLPAFTLATCAPAAIALFTDRVLIPIGGCTILPSLINVRGDLLHLVDRNREAQPTCTQYL